MPPTKAQLEEQLKELQSDYAVLERENRNLQRSKDSTGNALIKARKAARHYKAERDRLNGYLTGVLDSLKPEAPDTPAPQPQPYTYGYEPPLPATRFSERPPVTEPDAWES